MSVVRWGIIGCGDVTENKSGPGFQKADGSEMIDACRSACVPLFVAYYRRALPKYLRVAELIRSGTIGTVRCVEVTMFQSLRERDRDPAQRAWRVDPAVSGGGLLLDVGSHALDFLDLLLGPIELSSVVGRAANLGDAYDAEDTVTGIWRHAPGAGTVGPDGTGAYGTGLWCFCADRDEDRVTVYGDRGRLAFSALDVAAPILLETASGARGAAAQQVVDVPPPEHVQQPLIQTVVNELRGMGRCPSTGESALRTDLVMARLRASE